MSLPQISLSGARWVLLPALALPGAAASVPVGPAPAVASLLWRTVLALPMIALPVLLALTRLRRHQRRAAFGLGAGRLDRLRWIWLPQLGPGVLASLLLMLLWAMANRLLL